MRVVIHFPDDGRAAQGLYGAALAVERIGRKDKAIELLTECLGHAHLDEQTRRWAAAMLARLELARKSGGQVGSP
jgi:hypothetical protein